LGVVSKVFLNFYRLLCFPEETFYDKRKVKRKKFKRSLNFKTFKRQLRYQEVRFRWQSLGQDKLRDKVDRCLLLLNGGFFALSVHWQVSGDRRGLFSSWRS